MERRRRRRGLKHAALLAAIVAIFLAVAPRTWGAEGTASSSKDDIFVPKPLNLLIPLLDSEQGRRLFVSKGCVICHSINGVGGRVAPSLDAADRAPLVNPFVFAADMLRGAEAMIALQRQNLGYLIELTGEELANITGFAYDSFQQAQFREREIPEIMRELMESLSRQ